MKMNDYISDFTKHLTEALEIGKSTLLSDPHADIHNVLICGLGGSGIGGTIVNDLVSEHINVPISATKDYSIPNFVDENTLVIASSYSGNTEETLYALEACQKRRAQIACVTSGGALEKLAKEKGFNCITIPGGQPPRAMFGYSFTQLFFLLNHYGLIDDSFISEFDKGIALLDSEEEAINLRPRS